MHYLYDDGNEAYVKVDDLLNTMEAAFNDFTAYIQSQIQEANNSGLLTPENMMPLAVTTAAAIDGSARVLAAVHQAIETDLEVNETVIPDTLEGLA